jgi:hypothetical protein
MKTDSERTGEAAVAGAAPCSANLTHSEREQIATILSRRANEIAGYSGDNRDKMPASVEYGLELEMKRLRRLADKVRPLQPETDDE